MADNKNNETGLYVVARSEKGNPTGLLAEFYAKYPWMKKKAEKKDNKE